MIWLPLFSNLKDTPFFLMLFQEVAFLWMQQQSAIFNHIFTPLFMAPGFRGGVIHSVPPHPPFSWSLSLWISVLQLCALYFWGIQKAEKFNWVETETEKKENSTLTSVCATLFWKSVTHTEFFFTFGINFRHLNNLSQGQDFIMCLKLKLSTGNELIQLQAAPLMFWMDCHYDASLLSMDSVTWFNMMLTLYVHLTTCSRKRVEPRLTQMQFVVCKTTWCILSYIMNHLPHIFSGSSCKRRENFRRPQGLFCWI